MKAVTLSRVTTVLVVGAVGGVVGHTLWPFAPMHGAVKPAAFVAVMLATGGFRGWREATVRGDPAIGRNVTLYALGALAVAMLGYVVMHGAPK